MSSSLEWSLPLKGFSLSGDKQFLLEAYSCPLKQTFTREDLPYLRGAKDAGKDLSELIKLIENHGTIIVKEVW